MENKLWLLMAWMISGVSKKLKASDIMHFTLFFQKNGLSDVDIGTFCAATFFRFANIQKHPDYISAPRNSQRNINTLQ
ncbi:hypothetical protein AYI68_g4499 [Smittium mucronatum]|uniref:Uncharacterized protein n=1 Tax=Smittium mucronatum TaxID=133383 RepID=A0A1R0GWX4_9FUNG|nr:hypothetical protein AYI68_g4499 [Smittium mucronatum]